MLHQRYLQNYLLLPLAVYLIKAVVDPLRVFSTNYYNIYPKLCKIVKKVIKAAQMRGTICSCSLRFFFLRPFCLLTHPFFAKLS